MLNTKLPFYVLLFHGNFNIFILFIRSLDDYWYYSIMTLGMLMLFEGMLCKQRLSSLQMLRGMRRASVMIPAFRAGRWVDVHSDNLVPGDIVSFTSQNQSRLNGTAVRGLAAASENEYVIPCDALLIRGQCVMNEAMLTGSYNQLYSISCMID